MARVIELANSELMESLAGGATEKDASLPLAPREGGLCACSGDYCYDDADADADADAAADADHIQGHTLGINAYLGLGVGEEKLRDVRNKSVQRAASRRSARHEFH